MRRSALLAGWSVAVAAAVVGAIWLTSRLSANYPGDAGPVVGPGAFEKTRYGAVAGLIIVAAAVAAGALVATVTEHAGRRRSISR